MASFSNYNMEVCYLRYLDFVQAIERYNKIQSKRQPSWQSHVCNHHTYPLHNSLYSRILRLHICHWREYDPCRNIFLTESRSKLDKTYHFLFISEPNLKPNSACSFQTYKPRDQPLTSQGRYMYFLSLKLSSTLI